VREREGAQLVPEKTTIKGKGSGPKPHFRRRRLGERNTYHDRGSRPYDCGSDTRVLGTPARVVHNKDPIRGSISISSQGPGGHRAAVPAA
jgi:hypothetical protein